MHLYADVSEGLIKSERRIITERDRKKNAQAKLFVNLAATLGIHCLPMLSARLLCIRGPAEIKIIWLSQKSNRAGKLLSSTRTILPYKLLIE